MDTARRTRRRVLRERVGNARRHALSANVLVPLAVVAVVLGLLLRPALTSPVIAIGAAGLLGLTILVTALGVERASTTLLVLAFGFAPLTALRFGPKPLVLASAFFAIAFFLVLPRLLREPLRLPSMFVVGSILFTAMGLLAVPLADLPVESALYLVTAVVALIGMPAAVVWMRPTNSQMYAMVLAFGIGTAASTLIGLPQYTYRNPGFTYHPVALAYTATLTLAFVPFLLASKQIPSRWLVVPPVAALAFVGIWTSGSRTGLVVLIALAVIIPVMERSIRFGLVIATGVVLTLPTIFSIDPQRGDTSAIGRLLGAGGAQASDNTRLTTLRDGLEQIKESPIFGSGYSTEHTYVIHNLYLQVLAAEGLIGLVGLLLMLTAFVIPLRKASALHRALAYPAVAIILSGPFQPNMGDHYLGMTLGLSLVAAVAVMDSRRPPDDAAPPQSETPTVPGFTR